MFQKLSDRTRTKVLNFLREASRDPRNEWNIFYEAWKALAQEDVEGAKTRLRQILATTQNMKIRAAAERTLGNLERERGDLDTARDFYLSSLQSEPESMIALADLAELSVQSGDYATAESFYRKAVAAVSDEADVNFLEVVARDFAVLLVKLGRRTEAISILRELLSRYRETPHLAETLEKIEASS